TNWRTALRLAADSCWLMVTCLRTAATFFRTATYSAVVMFWAVVTCSAVVMFSVAVTCLAAATSWVANTVTPMARPPAAPQTAVTAAGLCLWTLATIVLLLWYPLREQLITLAVLPLVVVVGMFPTSFTPPFGRKFTKETITFTASDAFILIVACSYGVFPAVVIAGVDAFISSLRTVRRLSSNLFSAGMISLSAAMGGYGLHAVLRYGFAEKSFNQVYPFRAATVALLVGSILQVIVNWGLLSTLLALRHDSSILREWKEKLV